MCLNCFSVSQALKKSELDVLVCTCQVLVNCFQEAILRVEDVCVLVLDEAHNATKASPMAVIAKKVHEVEDPSHRPLLLGMTASPLENPRSLETIEPDLIQFANQIKCHPCYPIEHDPFKNGYNNTQDWCKNPEAEPAEAKFQEQLGEYARRVAEECQPLGSRLGSKVLERALSSVLRDVAYLHNNKLRGDLREFYKSLRERATLENDENRIPKELLDMGNALYSHFVEILAILEINNVVGPNVAKAVMHNLMSNFKDPKSAGDMKKKKLLMPNGRWDIIKDMYEAVRDSHDIDAQYASHG